MDLLERQRYVEYFQRQLLPEGADEFWQAQNAWFESNRSALAEKLLSNSEKADASIQAFAAAILEHQNQVEYDNFFANQIFEPLVRTALDICKEGGFAPRNQVRFVNSPGLEPSPAALPSSDEHLLFAGQGTFAFCNYWSKVFSSAIAEISELPTEERSSHEAAITKLQQDPVLVDAFRLALHYACFDSLIGFGRLEQPQELLGLRMRLVTAMEIFIIGHEIGHFLGHEAYPDTSGIPPGQDTKSHELECDAIGLAISTAYGVREDNVFAFQLIGPLLLFYALRTCEQVKSILFGSAPAQSESHPSHEARFRYALDFLEAIEAKEDTMVSVRFALDVAIYVGSQIQLIARDLKASVAAD